MPKRSLHRIPKLAARVLLPIIAIALARKPVPHTPSAPSSPSAFLPSIAAIPQAVDAGEIEEFDRENLWINLNGAATYYLDYGCLRMATRSYRVRTDSLPEIEIVVKIFDMQNPLFAFGLFSQFRSTDMEFRKIGAEGSLSSSDLLFYRGRYLVDVLLADPSLRAPALLESVSRQIDSGLPVGSGRPVELGLLPAADRIPYSERFVRQNGLGFGFLRNGLSAEYRIGTDPTRLFVFTLASADSAGEALTRFSAELSEVHPLTPPLGDRALRGIDPFAGETLLLTLGKRLVLLQGTADSEASRNLLRECVGTVGKR
ncbi:MAG: hypothetical protein HOC74_43190 [Gemmatimonadetes bacterium]|nr:hypothetical protein [Gemmatimonadota bacterium]